ncbi:hypothetical protein D3C78_1719530 [compost metagenome]
MSAQNTAFFKDQTDQFVLHTGGLFGFQGLAPDELPGGGFPGDGPGHIGGQR